MKVLKKILEFENLLKITFIVFVIILAYSPLSDLDMFFHVKNGQNIFYNGISNYDSFSMQEGMKYIQYNWLSDIIFYLAYSINGFSSLWIFKIIFTGGFFLLLYYVLLQMTGKNSTISFFTAAFIVMVNSAFITIRPQILSHLILILEILVLEKYEKTREQKYLFWLPLLSLGLVNIHGAITPLFFVFAGVYIVSNWTGFVKSSRISSSSISKGQNVKLICAVIISLIITLANPGGYKTLLYSLNIFSKSEFISYISELKPLTINSEEGFLVFLVLILIFIVFFVTKQKVLIKQILFILGTFFMAYSVLRFETYFLIFAIMFFAQYVSSIVNNDLLKNNEICFKIFKTRNLLGNLLFVVPFIVVIYFNQIPTIPKVVDFENYPTEVVSILKNEKNLRLFNDLNYGHYLIFNDIKVFIDGRIEMYSRKMNNSDAFDDFITAAFMKKNPQEIFGKYDFNYYLIIKERPISWYFLNNTRYIKVFESEDYILYKNS